MKENALTFLGPSVNELIDKVNEDVIATAKYALGNMLGSMTYMYGDPEVYGDEDHLIHSEPKTSMFVIVPDRPDHAQGFMWDEGFHQHLVSLWNPNITYEIISSWFAQAHKDGWIAR